MSKFLPISFIYLKFVAINRGYSPKTFYSISRKFIKLVGFTNVSSKVKFSISVVFLFYPHVSFQITKIFKRFNLCIIFSSISKMKFSRLKYPIRMQYTCDIFQIPYQCGLSGSPNVHLNCVKEYEGWITHQNSKLPVAQYSWNCNIRFDFSSMKIIEKCDFILHLDF